jgi:putative ABC transport system ATP-binding protein
MMLLEVNGLSKQYRRGGRDFFALRDAAFSLDEGDFAVITGRSGSGKSTLLNSVIGILQPSSGSVIFSGRDIRTLTDVESSLYRNACVGYVPQGQSLLANLTVLDNVRLPFYLHTREGDATAQALALLEEAGIAHLAAAYPKQLSGGEQRRAAIARAHINHPALLVADEPSADLDTETRGEIMALFVRVAQTGTAILLVSHETDALNYGSKFFIMAAGELTEKT